MSEIRVKSTGTIKLFESDNTSSVTIASPASLGGDRTITIPDADVNLTNIAVNTAKTSNATHSGEVTGATALTIADNIVDEANLKNSNTPTNGHFLSAQSSNSGGLTWAAAGGGGKVLQVITHNLASNHTMSSGTLADVTGMTPSITMSSSSTKLLVFCGMSVRLGGNGATVTPSSNTFITDSSNNKKAGQYWYFNVASNGHTPTISCYMQALWTPGASGSYQVKLRTNNASEGGYVQFYAQNGGSSSLTTSFTLIELDA